MDYTLIRQNQAFERLIGIPLDDVKGRPVSEVVPGLESWWTETFAEVVAEGRPPHIEREVPQLGRWCALDAYPEGGDRFIALFEEITQRKRAEITLRDNESRLRIATEAAELGVFEWNPSNDTVSWEDDRMFEIFNRTREQGALNAAIFMADVVILTTPSDSRRSLRRR